MRFSRTPQESWPLGMKPYKVHPMGLETEHTLSLNSMSALYPVFSHLMLTMPPSSAVIVPIKIPGDKKIENKLFSVSKGLLSNTFQAFNELQKSLQKITSCFGLQERSNVKRFQAKIVQNQHQTCCTLFILL